MKITDIIFESKKVNEAPVGMIKRAGLGIASKLGSTKAMGALDTAKTSNELKKAYDRYLGQTGQKPSSDSIIAFLQRNGLPTDGAEKAIKQAGIDVGVQVAPAKDMKQTLGIKPTNQPGAIPNQRQAAASPAEEPAAPAASAGSSTATSAAPAAVNYDEPAYKRQGKPEPEFMTPQQVLKSKLKSGKGIGKGTGGGFGSAVKAGRAKGLNMSHTPNGNAVMEVDLKGSTVDKIILAAVQDAIKAGYGQKLSDISAGGGASGDDASGGGGVVSSFMRGVKQGVTGQEEPGQTQTKGNLNYGKLSELLPGIDANVLRKSITNYMAGTSLTRDQMSVMSTAFGELIKMGPAEKVKVLQLLKAVRPA